MENFCRSWCRLCGSADETQQIDENLEQIAYMLTEIPSINTPVCQKCTSFLNMCTEFVEKAKQIQIMFEELNKLPDERQKNIDEINKIREKYQLSYAEEIVSKDDVTLTDEEEYLEEHLTDFEQTEQSNSEKVPLEKIEIETSYDEKCYIKECSEESQEDNFSQQTIIAQSEGEENVNSVKRPIEDLNSCYSCNMCKLQYKTLAAYEKHVSKKHSENPAKFICSQCGRSFKEKQILKNHERVHLPPDLKLKYPCTYCEKKFVNSHCLKIHIARIHEKVAFFFCEICGKGCTTKSDLQWHLDKHTQTRNFSCDICSLKFKSSNSLRIHKRRHMSVEATKQCNICKKQFRSSAALSNHKIVHSEEKKYKCTYCPNSYKRLETYKCHLSTHTGERPFKCLFCPRTFVNSANCRKHKLKDHPGEVEAYEKIHGKRGVSLSVKYSEQKSNK